MDIIEIRRRNFFALKQQLRDSENGQGIPERGELNRLSELTKISAQYLSHIKNGRKRIGHSVARKMEVGFNLPTGWMDVDHLSGAIPMDSKARKFGEMVMRLYMQDADGLRELLMNYMEKKIQRDESPELTSNSADLDNSPRK